MAGTVRLRRTVAWALAYLGLIAAFATPGPAASAHAVTGASALVGSPLTALVGARCLRSPLDPIAVPVCYTASANVRFQVVLMRKEYERIGGVGWGGTTGLSAAADGCKGGVLVTCRASVSVTRPELLTIVPGRQRDPRYVTPLAYVYMDVATPPVPTQPLRVRPPTGTFLISLKGLTPSPTPESGWVSEILFLHRAEKLPALRLPTNFYRLDSAEQLFVLINLERTTRGLLPYFGLSAATPSFLSAIRGRGLHLPPGSLDVAQAGVADPARAVVQWLYNYLAQPAPTCSRADPAECPAADDVILQQHDGLAGMFDPLFVYVAGSRTGGSAVRLAVGAGVHGASLSAPADGPLAYTWADAVAEGASPAR